MQDQPTTPQLLGAVERFLLDDLIPTITDSGLRFRVLIAANLLRVVTSEMGAEDGHFLAELARLRDLMPGEVDPADADLLTQTSRRSALVGYNRALVERMRSGDFASDDPALWSHIKATLIETLEVANPRFDPQAELP